MRTRVTRIAGVAVELPRKRHGALCRTWFPRRAARVVVRRRARELQPGRQTLREPAQQDLQARRSGVVVAEVGVDVDRRADLAGRIDAVDATWLRSKGAHVKELAFMVGERGGPAAPMRRLFVARVGEEVLGYISFSPAYGRESGWLHGPSRPPGPARYVGTAGRNRGRRFREEAAGGDFGLTRPPASPTTTSSRARAARPRAGPSGRWPSTANGSTRQPTNSPTSSSGHRTWFSLSMSPSPAASPSAACGLCCDSPGRPEGVRRLGQPCSDQPKLARPDRKPRRRQTPHERAHPTAAEAGRGQLPATGSPSRAG